MDLEKIKIMLYWPMPRNITRVKSFYGLASFYKRIVRNIHDQMYKGENVSMDEFIST